MIKRKKNRMNMTSVVLSLSLFMAGCSGGSSTVLNSPEGINDPAVQEEPIEITIANNFDPPDYDGNFVQKYLEKKFNVKITNVKFDRSNWKEKFNVLLASGEIPDIFVGDTAENEMVQWADQDIIASISVDELRTYMPKYIEDVESVAPNAWAVGMYKEKNWGVPRVWGDGTTGFMLAYNEHWLNSIGYNRPPQTLKELEDVLTKFTGNDPDGNGKNDTYGITGRAKDYTPQMFNSIFAAFGIAPYQYKADPDGKLVYGATTEETRQALMILSKWYKAGIIDPEFITTDNGKIRENFVSGRIGMFDTAMWYHLLENGYFGKEAKDKNVKIVIGKPVTGPGGYAYAMTLGALQAPLMFGKQLETDEKKRIRILQMLEFMATDSEGYLTTKNGEKGVHYDLVGDVAVPKPEFVNDGTRGAEIGAGGFYNPFIGKVNAMLKHDISKEKLEFKEAVTRGVMTLSDALGPAVLVSKTKYESLLKSMQDQYFIKAITGEADTNKDFDDFVALWLKSGGKEVTDDVNQLYKERQKLQ